MKKQYNKKRFLYLLKKRKTELSFIYRATDNLIKECASSVQIIQFGESPNPTKLSKQSVHSLGAEAVR